MVLESGPFPKLPVSLTNLVLHGGIQPDEPVECSLPNLQFLSCKGMTQPVVSALMRDSCLNNTLAALSVMEPPLSSSRNYFPAATSLLNLSLTKPQYEDSELIKIVAQYPNLQELYFEDARVTGVMVKQFVQQGVKKLHLPYCSHLKNDVVLWAMKQGMEVDRYVPLLGDSYRFRIKYLEVRMEDDIFSKFW